MDKHISHVQVMKKKYLLNKRDILNATGMDEAEYNTFQFDCAVAYIKANTLHDDEIVNIMLGQPIFKAWWINQWNMIDDAYVSSYYMEMCSDLRSADYLKQKWQQLHDVKYVVATPPENLFAVVIETVTARMKENDINKSKK